MPDLKKLQENLAPVAKDKCHDIAEDATAKVDAMLENVSPRSIFAPAMLREILVEEIITQLRTMNANRDTS